MPASTTGISTDKAPLSINCTATLPSTDPKKAVSMSGLIRTGATLPFLTIIKAAVAVPTVLWNLLVPNAARGGAPARIRAGSVNSPPPPASVSRKPATTAIRNKNTRASAENGASSGIIRP